PKTPTVEMPPAPPAPANAIAPAPLSPTPMPASSITPAPSSAVNDPAGTRARQLAHLQSQKESKFTFLLLIVVVPYAIIMTIAVIFLVLTRPGPAPREFPQMVPDNGEGSKTSIQKRADDNRPLNDSAKVALGSDAPLRVGDIEVRPVKVAWAKVMYAIEN